jgi:hypothetical protein
MIFTSGGLVVVNQNVNTNLPGEVLQFNGMTGTFIGKLVASSDRNAPFAPRGIVRGGPDQGFYVKASSPRGFTPQGFALDVRWALFGLQLRRFA